MEMKNAVWIAVVALIGIVLAVAIVNNPGANSVTTPSGETGGTPKLLTAPDLAEKTVAYTATSEKAAAPTAQLADLQETGPKTETELSVYNAQTGYESGYALVKEVRSLLLKTGLNNVVYKDVASQIDATSVLVHDLKSSDTTVLEQNYEYDLVSREKILEKYLGKEITVEASKGTTSETFTGTLLGYKDGIILDTSTGIVNAGDISTIRFPSLPEGLITKPTLVWKIFTPTEGEREVETTYLTNGIKWNADYIALVNANDNAMDFKGWVTVDNQSGTAYPNAKLKLVAGDVHRVTPPQTAYDYAPRAAGMVSESSAKQFTEQSLFEYHMYTLDRTTDVANNETKQISLLESANVPVKKILYYDGANTPLYYYGGTTDGTGKVQVRLQFDNKKENGLGLPLPKGKVRVYKLDSEGKQQFVGEDEIDHTPENNLATLYLGDSFDVTGKRTVTDNTQVTDKRYRQTVQMVLKNAKDSAQEVVVAEHLGTNWTITDKTDNYDKKDAYTIEFNVSVPAKGEKTVEYTVEYQYY